MHLDVPYPADGRFTVRNSLLAHLPVEIVEHILSVSPLADVSAFAQTCRTHRDLVYRPRDNHLWRTLFLNQPEYDDPRSVLGPDTGIPWDLLLRRWTKASTALCKHAPPYTVETLEVLIEMADYVQPAKGPMVLDSRTLRHLRNLLQAGGFFDSTTLWEEKAEPKQKQMLSRLRVYAGLEAIVPTAARRLRARSFVYDLRNYDHTNNFGPFFPDGGVNWNHVQAIQQVIAMNILDFVDIDHTKLLPMSLSHIQTGTIPCRSVDDRDWARLTGKWQVVFCFCDHRDLLAFNQLGANQNAPDLSVFDEEFEEALRFLEFDLSLVNVEEEASAVPIFRCARPTLHFVGTVSGNARVRGKVLMTPDKQVRWSFVSGEPGQTIWSTEAVQIGGLASAFGALGSWTTVFHDMDDPVGPMWLWKLPD